MPTVVEPTATDDTEAIFRRTMAGATDVIWGLGYEDEALTALHDVIEYATIQHEAGENRRGDVSE
jgi:hypothetical protein